MYGIWLCSFSPVANTFGILSCNEKRDSDLRRSTGHLSNGMWKLPQRYGLKKIKASFIYKFSKIKQNGKSNLKVSLSPKCHWLKKKRKERGIAFCSAEAAKVESNDW